MAPFYEIIKALYASIYLAKFDSNGFNYLGTTITSFWRSFSAAAIVLPFFLILVIMRFNRLEIESGFPRYLGLDLCSYTLSWLVFPLIIEGISRSLNRRGSYIKFMVAYNWSMVPQNILYAIIIIASYVGLFSNKLANTLTLFVLMWTFALTWFVVRKGLGVSAIIAIGLVIIDFLLSLIIEVTVNSRY